MELTCDILLVIVVLVVFTMGILIGLSLDLTDDFEDFYENSFSDERVALRQISDHRPSTVNELYYAARALLDRNRDATAAADLAFTAAAADEGENAERINDLIHDIRHVDPNAAQNLPRPVNATTALIAVEHGINDPAMAFAAGRNRVQWNTDDLDDNLQRTLLESFRNTQVQPRWRVEAHNVHDSAMNTVVADKVQDLVDDREITRGHERGNSDRFEEFVQFTEHYLEHGSATGITPSNVINTKKDGIDAVFNQLRTGRRFDGRTERQIASAAWRECHSIEEKEALANAVIDSVNMEVGTVCQDGRLSRIIQARETFSNEPKLITKSTARNIIFAKCANESDTLTRARVDEIVDEFKDQIKSTHLNRIREECYAGVDDDE